MFSVAYSIITHGTLSVPARFGMLGRHGYYYSKWYPLLSFIALPFVALGSMLGAQLGMPPRYTAQAATLVLPVIFLALNVYLTVLLSLTLGATRRGAFWAAIAFAFGTIALVYAREFFADPLLATLTTVGLYSAFHHTGPKSQSVTFSAAALAVLAKPTGIVLGPCLSLYGLLKNRPIFTDLVSTLGTGAGLAIYLLYNWIRFGCFLTFGQPYAFSLKGIPFGLFGLLASPGRGLFWYCPVVLTLVGVPLAVYKKTESLIILFTIGSYLGFYAAWGDWDGGWCWGPRFLLPILPGLMAFTGLLDSRWRKALGILTMVGFIVNSPNLVGYYVRYYHEANVAGISESARLWSFRDGPLFGVWRSDYHQLSEALQPSSDVREVIREAGATPSNDPFQSPCLRVVPLWWWFLPALGIPRSLGAAIALLLLCIGIAAIVRSIRAT